VLTFICVLDSASYDGINVAMLAFYSKTYNEFKKIDTFEMQFFVDHDCGDEVLNRSFSYLIQYLYKDMHKIVGVLFFS